MKKLLIVTLVLGFITFSGTSSEATTWWEFTIDGADLMSYATANGEDGTTAVQNGLYDGARLYRDGGLRSYWDSTNDDFVNWATTTELRLASFNLWGYDGNGMKWGEFYKVQYWNEPSSTVPGWSNDSNWEGWIVDWPWGTPPENNDGRLLGWDTTDGYDSGLSFGDTDYPTFTFRLGLDENDAFFDNGGWHNGIEGQLVFWFGGSMINGNDEWADYYEGNLVLQGTISEPVPEPSTILLFGAGLFGLLGFGRKKFSRK